MNETERVVRVQSLEPKIANFSLSSNALMLKHAPRIKGHLHIRFQSPILIKLVPN